MILPIGTRVRLTEEVMNGSVWSYFRGVIGKITEAFYLQDLIYEVAFTDGEGNEKVYRFSEDELEVVKEEE